MAKKKRMTGRAYVTVTAELAVPLSEVVSLDDAVEVAKSLDIIDALKSDFELLDGKIEVTGVHKD